MSTNTQPVDNFSNFMLVAADGTIGVESVTRDPCYTDYVSNLTLTIDAEVLRRARIRAINEDTSVNALVREFLVEYASGGDEWRQTAEGLIEIAKSAQSGGLNGRTWTREDLYARN